MAQKVKEPRVSELVTLLPRFMESYNQSIPEGFPRATAKNLEEFQTAFPVLFRSGSGWSIDKHRKRVMDWLSSRHTV